MLLLVCGRGGGGLGITYFDVFSLLLPKQTTDQLTRAYVKGRVLGVVQSARHTRAEHRFATKHALLWSFCEG